MVSFSCESCGDVLTKKKLDAHRNQCRGATYTCLDCMVHFRGTEYRAHTSCISEAQKYQGALYKPEKGKKGKQAQAQAQAPQSTALVSKKAYVEDAPDPDSGAVAVVSAPPRAPSPPAAVNVFDFLVTDDTPNASRVSLAPPKEQMSMIRGAPAVFSNGGDGNGKPALEETDYAYGSDPISVHAEQHALSVNDAPPKPEAYTTPASKSRDPAARTKTPKGSKSDKKRKRQHPDELDLSMHRPAAAATTTPAARPTAGVDDEIMTDAPPILHSGLTGGLNRLMRGTEFPPSPDYSGVDDARDGMALISPVKRTKNSATTTTVTTYGIKDDKRGSERERERERGQRTSSGQTSSTRKSSHTTTTSAGGAGSDTREHKSKHRRRHHHRDREDSSRSSSHRAHAALPPPRPLKAIEYHPSSSNHAADADADADSADADNALILYRRQKTTPAAAADLFTSLVTKGPDSERGLSVHKVLKRYHRERGDRGYGGGGGGSRAEEERELWQTLRLRRNERGEVVVFF